MARPTYERLNVPTAAFYVSDASWGGYQQSVVSTDVSVDSRTYSGTTTPNFRALAKGSRKRKLPINPYTVTYSRSWGGPLDYRATWPDGRWFYSFYTDSRASDNFRPFSSVPNQVNEVEQQALARLGKRVSHARSNLAVTFAERKQTVNLILDTAGRVARAAHSLRRGNLYDVYLALGLRTRPTRREIRAVHNTKPHDRMGNHWLEYKYGWTPLLSDVRDNAEMLASMVTEQRYLTSVSSTSAKSFDYRWYMDANGRIWDVTDSYRVRYAVRYGYDDVAKAALAKTGIANPALVAWELLPYSFVIDWFLPVGNYLQQLQAFDGYSLTEGFKTVTRRCKISKSWSFSQINSDGSYGVRYGTGGCEDQSYDRSPVTSWPPTLPPRFQNPFQSPLSVGALEKYLTSMALLRNAFR